MIRTNPFHSPICFTCMKLAALRIYMSIIWKVLNFLQIGYRLLDAHFQNLRVREFQNYRIHMNSIESQKYSASRQK